MPLLPLKNKIAGIVYVVLFIFMVASFGVNILLTYIHSRDTKRISFLEDKTKLPLGYINKGSPFPNWAAKKSVNTVAGIDLIGYLVKDDGKYNVVIEPADRRDYFCGGHIDSLDPSLDNKYIPCKSIIIVKDNADFDGAGNTILGDNLIAVDMSEMQTGKGEICCLTIMDSYVDWRIAGEK